MLQHEHEGVVCTLHEEKGLLEAELSRLRNDILAGTSDKNAETARLCSQLSTVETELSQERNTVALLSAVNKEMTQALESSKQQCDDVESRLRELSAQHDGLKAESLGHVSRVDVLESQLHDAQADVSRLVEEKNAGAAQIDGLVSENGALREQIALALGAKSDAVREKEAAQKDLSDQQSHCAELEQQIETMKVCVRSLFSFC